MVSSNRHKLHAYLDLNLELKSGYDQKDINYMLI